MLSEIFYWVLNLSVLGSIAGAALLILRKIKKLPRPAVYFMWIIPLLRFWIPVGIANEYSLLTLISRITTKTVVIWRAAPELSVSNFIMAADSYFPIVFQTDLLAGGFAVSSIIWAAVSLTAIFASVFFYCMNKKEGRRAVHKSGNLYLSDQISAPAVYGILRPRIVIPNGTSEEEIGYIVMHEQAHIKRGDNLFRMIAVITACVHWFNPLSWVFLRCFFADMEFACDSRVVRQLGQEKLKDYAKSILNCSASGRFFASAFGGAKARPRIENILSCRKMSLFSAVTLFVFIIVTAIALITNAAR